VKRVKPVARKATDELRGAAKLVADQSRRVAEQAFEKIKAARARAAKLST